MRSDGVFHSSFHHLTEAQDSGEVAIIEGAALLYALAGVALVGSIVTTSVKRRRAKAAKSG